MCDTIESVTNGRFQYCDREATEEREIEINKPEHNIKGTITQKFCSYHAALFDIHERKDTCG